jgi:hypothetical protein
MRADYDLVVQLHHSIVRDVHNRTINESLLSNLALTSPVSRVIENAIPPFQMKGYWDNPKLNIANDQLRLSTDVRGGARYTIKGINLTMKGNVHVDCKVKIVMTTDGQPVATLTAPSMVDLDLADLKLTYEGNDELLSWIDSTIEQTLLRPSIAQCMMIPLAGLPLSYLRTWLDPTPDRSY